MHRGDVEQRLLLRHPDLPPGVVLAMVGRVARRLALAGHVAPALWRQVELGADEQLLLRQTMHLQPGGL